MVDLVAKHDSGKLVRCEVDLSRERSFIPTAIPAATSFVCKAMVREYDSMLVFEATLTDTKSEIESSTKAPESEVARPLERR